jgi:polysaccharide export outer membrane protein
MSRIVILVAWLLALNGLIGGNPVDAAGRLLTAGDVLQVNVVNQAELNTAARIEPDGTIALPYVGRIKAAGLTQDQLRQQITAALKKADVVKDPQVLVELTTFGTQVSVLGEVGLPGTFTLDRPTTLIQVLSRAGGVKEDAGAGTVVLRRRGPKGSSVYRYNVKAIESGETGGDVFLQNNDEVYVEQVTVYFLYGYVNKPGEYPLGRTFSVAQAIAAGGGVAPLGSDWRIEIKRRLPDGTVKNSSASLDDIVEPDDTIIVNERIF